jgi:hypothetical protein
MLMYIELVLKERNIKSLEDLGEIDRFSLLSTNKLPKPNQGKKRSVGGIPVRRFNSANVFNNDNCTGNYIHYSKSGDKVYCLSCAFFSTKFENYQANQKPTSWINGVNDLLTCTECLMKKIASFQH